MKNSVIKKSFILSLGLLALLVLFSCGKKNNAGRFELRDGEETYIYDGQVIKNRLVDVDGKLYYLDNNGHKTKDEWAIIDNDGHYGYFGNFGDLVINKIRTIDGKDYYFDEKGCLYQDRTESKIKVINGDEYIANAMGELTLASNKVKKEDKKIEETTAAIKPTAANKQTQQAPTNAAQQTAAQQAAAQQAAQQAAAQAAAQQAAAQAAAQQAALQAAQASQVSTNPPFANAINITNVDTSIPNENGGPGVVGFTPNTTQNAGPGGGTSTVTSGATAQDSNEIKIVKTEKIVEEIDGDDYSCKITLLKPVLNGSTMEETNAINDSIDELMEGWYDEVAGIVNGYDVLPRSVTFSKATLGTVSKSKINISIEGTIRPKSGSSKNIKYRITYDRNEQNAGITKVGS